jgi:glucokinase
MSNDWLVGVDLGGTTTKLAFFNADGKMLKKWEIPTDNQNNGRNITINIAKSIDQALDQLDQPKSKLIGLGIGVPGPVDYATGTIYNTVNLGWQDYYPLKEILEVETSLPIFIDNDANCAALGEMWKGAGNGAKDLVCVTLGTGVGGGIITNGNIVQGAGGAAGEIGHIASVPNEGALCNCGKRGCLETIASATGIVRTATEKLRDSQEKLGQLGIIYKQKGTVTAKDVFDCAREEDIISKEVVEEVAFHLGLALANLANILNPEKIVLGGGVAKAGVALLDKVQWYFEKYSFSPVRESTKLSLAELGNDAGVIGAAWLVKNKLTDFKMIT